MKWQMSLINRPLKTVFASTTDPAAGSTWRRAASLRYILRYRLEPAEGGAGFTEFGEANPRGLDKTAMRLFTGVARRNSERGLKLLKKELEQRV